MMLLRPSQLVAEGAAVVPHPMTRTTIESVHFADEAHDTGEMRAAALHRPPATVTKQHLLRIQIMTAVPRPMMRMTIESAHFTDEAHATGEMRAAALHRPPATVTRQRQLRVQAMMGVPRPMTTATGNDPLAAFKSIAEP